MNADPIADWYARLEYAGFGRALERRRFAFLPEAAGAQRAIVLGEGDGRFLAKLVQQNPQASIDYVDLSERMLELARSRAGEARVRYRQADALELELPDGEFDLIVTHFFLDCLDVTEQAKLVDRLTRAALPDALWLISEFREPSWWARAIVASLYWFFRVTTGLRTNRLADHRSLLRRAGWRLHREQSGRLGWLASELWSNSSESRRDNRSST